ncbi:MAG: ABC transporter ATP-binding protein [Ruminococcaceae bacterium]|nr:ABC transporter ATP-binding protein [Oscillospiraceae bacterium]
MIKPKRKNYVSWIYRKVKKRIPAIMFQMLLSVAVSYANIQFSLNTKNLVNSAIAGDYNALIFCAGIMIALCLFRLTGNMINQFLSVNVQEQLERDFKRSILHTILRTDYNDISKYHSGELIQRMNGDANTVYGGVLGLTTGLAGMISALVTAVLALLNIAPQFTIICGLVAAAVGSTALFFRRVLKQLSKDSSAANGRVSGFMYESISKLMVVQALDVAEEVERRSDNVLDMRWAIRRKQRNVSMFARLGTTTISYTSYLVTMLWCVWQLYNGRITYGDVMAITSLVSTIRSSALQLPKTLPRLFTISAACDRIMDLEDLPRQADPDVQKVRSVYADMTGFRAENLTFAYDREPVMTDVSLTVPKGGLTVIVGPSGVGKSTLLKLLLGLYRPKSGTLSIETPDGSIPVDRSTRSLFTYAPQGNFLLSGSLRDNLRLTRPNATDEEIRHALYVSAMDEYVDSLPDGLDTMLRENGAGLSEGQGQRLSLARAILSGAPVLLLDEVTSALDAATEAIVLERICGLPDKTCIAVTHRPAALALADYVIEVTESGTTITEQVK